jgi:hypothetical protein
MANYSAGRFNVNVFSRYRNGKINPDITWQHAVAYLNDELVFAYYYTLIEIRRRRPCGGDGQLYVSAYKSGSDIAYKIYGNP